MKRIASLIALALLVAPAAAVAQIHQVSSSSDSHSTVNFTLGYFALRGVESRVDDDVLVADLLNQHPLLFEVNDFNGAVFSGEYLLAFGRHVEAGVGLGFSQKSVQTVYADLTHSSGDEINQELKLRQIPVTFTGRFLILPRGSKVEPYIGGGIVAIRYQYSEVGEFVDGQGNIFPNVYKVNGTTAGPIVLLGARAPVGRWTVGGEMRWQRAEASGLAAEGFLGDKLDLGGWTTNFTFGVRF